MENYTSYSVQNILNIFTNFSVLKSIPENSWKILSFFRLLFFEFQPFPAQCFVLILLKQFLINSEHIAQSYGKLFFLNGRSCNLCYPDVAGEQNFFQNCHFSELLAPILSGMAFLESSQ